MSSMNVINGDLISGDDHVTRSWSLSIIIIKTHDKDRVTPTGEMKVAIDEITMR